MFPNLITLHLRFESEPTWSSIKDDHILDTFHNSTRLRELTFSGDPYAIPFLPSAKFPWKQITRPSTSLWNPVTLPRLETLTLTPGDACLESILDNLLLPSLRRLQIDEQLSSSDCVLRAIRRWGCRLEELASHDGKMDDLSVIDFVHSKELEHVHTLRIGGFVSLDKDDSDAFISVSEDIIKGMTVESGDNTESRIPLPSLRQLTLTGGKQWTDDVLMDMVESRSSENIKRLSADLKPLERDIIFEDKNSSVAKVVTIEDGIRCLYMPSAL
ncbi:hypothetical protein PQX77_021326 [Marasmius sp. AFHP31]|nr:hypothetical protein PQX77_021326 [Marasmius sp. AFHP31]